MNGKGRNWYKGEVVYMKEESDGGKLRTRRWWNEKREEGKQWKGDRCDVKEVDEV